MLVIVCQDMIYETPNSNVEEEADNTEVEQSHKILMLSLVIGVI